MNYVIVKYLRKTTDYVPDLLLQDYNSILDHPAWEDVPMKIPQDIIRNNIVAARKIFGNAIAEFDWQMPTWIKQNPITYSLYDKFIAKYIDKSHTAKKRINHYVNDLKKYDFVFTDGFGATTALLAKTPYVVRPYGTDIDIQAFENNYVGNLINKALRQSSAIFAHGYTDNLQKLGIENKRKHVSVVIDTDILKPQEKQPNQKTEFFIGSRLEFNLKGTDKAIKAFASLLKSYDAHLYCLEYGSDVQKTRQLVDILGIKDNVTFYNFVASKPVLAELYAKHDAVIGNLNYGTIGTTELEALACNTPVIAGVKPKTQLEKDLPIMNSFSEDEIFKSMKNICEKRDIPVGLRDFIIKNFGIKQFLEGFESVIRTI